VGYRLVFGFVALILVVALLVYRRAPEAPLPISRRPLRPANLGGQH
jgi:hypothetical protein